jgi:hypothetical protein
MSCSNLRNIDALKAKQEFSLSTTVKIISTEPDLLLKIGKLSSVETFMPPSQTDIINETKQTRMIS